MVAEILREILTSTWLFFPVIIVIALLRDPLLIKCPEPSAFMCLYSVCCWFKRTDKTIKIDRCCCLLISILPFDFRIMDHWMYLINI